MADRGAGQRHGRIVLADITSNSGPHAVGGDAGVGEGAGGRLDARGRDILDRSFDGSAARGCRASGSMEMPWGLASRSARYTQVMNLAPHHLRRYAEPDLCGAW